MFFNYYKFWNPTNQIILSKERMNLQIKKTLPIFNSIKNNTIYIKKVYFSTFFFEFITYYDFLINTSYTSKFEAFFFKIQNSMLYRFLFNKNNTPIKNSTNFFFLTTTSKPFYYFSIIETVSDSSINNLPLVNYSLPNSFSKIEYELIQKNQELLLKKIDQQFWNETLATKSFFYSNYDLFEYFTTVPFLKNEKLNEFIFGNLTWSNFFSFNYMLATYDLLSSFYFEPFFFFWEKIQQSLDEFWLICYFWEWSLLFDDWVYHPTITINDQTHILPALSHLAHPSDFKAGYRIYKRLFDYKNTQDTSYYLEFEDLQAYALDKNFIHLWNYWVGAYNSLNIFSNWGWTGILNFLREWISSPWFHFDSKFYWINNSYESYYTKALQVSFFPDFAMLWGQFNPNFDWLTSGFNWFFHFGETYFDSSVALDLIWYQIAENYWGEFENIVEDYTAYQSTYFPDNIATIWIPILLLATKKFNSLADMALHINDYNNVFLFKQIKQYQVLWADIFFSLDNLTKLELLWDPQPIDLRVFHLEKIINLYFGYNSSNFLANKPLWLITLTDSFDFYSTLTYDYNEDLKLEEREWNMITTMWTHNYDYSTNCSVFFKTFKMDSFLYNFKRFINEKIFDDSGYAITSLNWGDDYQNLKIFAWSGNFSLMHCEFLPLPHYSWKLTIFNSTPLEWSIFLPMYNKFAFNKFFSSIKNGFSFSFLQIKYFDTFFYWNELCLADKLLYTFYFEFNFLPLISFLRDYTSINKYLWMVEIFSKYTFKLMFKIFPIYNFFLISHSNFFFDKIYYNIFIYDKLFLNIYIKKIIEIFTFFAEFFISFEHFDTHIQLCVPIGSELPIAALDKLDISLKILPFEFFIPIFFYAPNNFVKIRVFTGIDLNNLIKLPDLTKISPKDLESIKWFFEYCMMAELTKTNSNTHNSSQMVNALNSIDYDELKKNSLDYDWYINYVVKKNLYKKKS